MTAPMDATEAKVVCGRCGTLCARVGLRSGRPVWQHPASIYADAPTLREYVAKRARSIPDAVEASGASGDDLAEAIDDAKEVLGQAFGEWVEDAYDPAGVLEVACPTHGPESVAPHRLLAAKKKARQEQRAATIGIHRN